MTERYSDDFDLPTLAAGESPLHGYRGVEDEGPLDMPAGLTIAISREAGARLPYKLDFCTLMLKYLAAWRKKGNEVLLMGDYNIAHQPIDLARPKENEKNAGYLPDERAWMTTFLGQGYHDVFRERNPDVVGAYTWWTNWGGARQRNVGWRIDYGCVTPGLVDRVTETSIQSRIMGSDHCPVTVALS